MAMNVLEQIWPEWQIEGEPIGRGSYGKVYKAVRRDHNVESCAAIKVISIPLDSSEVDSLRSEGLDMDATRTYLQGIVNDFVSEIQLMESLKGVQNIVSVEDYKVVEKTDKLGWDIYIRMELLIPFNTYLSGRKMTEAEVIKLGCDICTALEICSKRNIIHRDIKPENIFINDFGDFKLGDFGIARKMENMTAGFSQKGTVNYMAPEVANSGEYDARVDIYSLGIVLYRLLNGNRLPFLENEQQLMNPNDRRNAVERRMRGEKLPRPCDASKVMAEVLLCACAYDPNKRFSSAAAMKKALMSVAGSPYGKTEPEKLDRTASVQRNPADYDKTTSVRKAAPSPKQKPAQPEVNTFGDAPQKKKKKWPAAVALIFITAIAVGAGAVAVPKLMDGDAGAAFSEIAGKITGKSADEKADGKKSDKDSETAEETVGKSAREDSGESKAETEDSETAYKEKIASSISEAESLAAEQDYLGAVKVIDSALSESASDQELKDKKAEYEEAYADSVIEQADALVAEEKLDEAKTLLNKSVNQVSDNGKIKAKISVIDSLRPVNLNTLHVIDSNRVSEEEGIFVDSFGNAFDGWFHFKNIGSSASDCYAIFNLNQECTTFTGSVTTCQDTGSDEQMIVQIYVDDVLKYTSPQFGKTTGKLDFQVDVTGGQQLKIKPGLVSGYFGDACFSMVDAKMTRDPDAVAANLEQKEKRAYDPASAGLDKLFLIDSKNFDQKREIFTDSFGNSYDGFYHFKHVGSNNPGTYATFNITESSSTFSGSIVACQDTGSDEQMIVMIYVDDVLKYTSPQFGKTTGRLDFSIDTTGGQTITIKPGLISGYFGDACCSFVDLRLN
ncbi:MAG: protein kinase [Clostridium sp.]|nr:protein kinase [Clostridium sp.]